MQRSKQKIIKYILQRVSSKAFDLRCRCVQLKSHMTNKPRMTMSWHTKNPDNANHYTYQLNKAKTKRLGSSMSKLAMKLGSRSNNLLLISRHRPCCHTATILLYNTIVPQTLQLIMDCSAHIPPLSCRRHIWLITLGSNIINFVRMNINYYVLKHVIHWENIHSFLVWYIHYWLYRCMFTINLIIPETPPETMSAFSRFHKRKSPHVSKYCNYIISSFKHWAQGTHI